MSLDYTEPQLSGVPMLQDEKRKGLAREADSKSTNKRVFLGKAGEKAAADWLTKKGWQILETNWRNGKLAEIDIIAKDETKTIVFVEVKTRRHTDIEYGFRNSGFESVNYRKRKKIISCAFAYLNAAGGKRRSIRFDVIVVEFVEFLDSEPIIHHVLQAF